jgi:TPR repeat protein
MRIRSLLLLFLFTSLNALAKIPPFEGIKHQLDAPSEELRSLVTEGWENMNPARPASENNYSLAFELNLNAYQKGHPEGASNIGLLYEKGWGVERDLDSAQIWYLRAIAEIYHSAQAELGLARIHLTKPRSKENANKIVMYIQQAKATASAKGSLWRHEKDLYLSEADLLASSLNEGILKW